MQHVLPYLKRISSRRRFISSLFAVLLVSFLLSIIFSLQFLLGLAVRPPWCTHTMRTHYLTLHSFSHFLLFFSYFLIDARFTSHIHTFLSLSCSLALLTHKASILPHRPFLPTPPGSPAHYSYSCFHPKSSLTHSHAPAALRINRIARASPSSFCKMVGRWGLRTEAGKE